MPSWEQFVASLAPLRAALEQRRRRYLRYYYAGAGVAMLLLATAFFWPLATLHGIQMLLHVHAPLKSYDSLAYRIFALACTAGLVLAPVMGYRGERGFSVEQAVGARLLGQLGDFVPAFGGGIRALELRKTGLFAEALLFDPGAGIMGEINDVRVRLCEAAFFRRDDGADTLAFNGLFILCDTESPPSRAADNAAREQLQRLAQGVPAARLGWDEKFAFAATALYAHLKGAVMARIGKEELPAEKAYRLKYGVHPRLARPGQPLAKDTICESWRLEYPSGKRLAMIAGDNSLFALGSLFMPALCEERVRRLYDVMQGVATLTAI